MSIQSCSFSLAPINEALYQLDVLFEDHDASTSSRVQCIFNQATSPISGTGFDVYSQNGPFTLSDVMGVEKALTVLPKSAGNPRNQLGVVLDLTDSKKKYVDSDEIARIEDTVCKFFFRDNCAEQELQPDEYPKGIQFARAIYSQFKDAGLSLGWILREGSLKAELAKCFSEAQLDYFFNTPKGRCHFCQLTEFFINAFKFGQTGQVKDHQPISASPYMASSKSQFVPVDQNTVLYPKLYQKMYSEGGSFAKEMKHVFDLTGRYDENTGITALTYARKL